MSSSFAIQMGKNIRAARSALGLTLQDVAERLGVTRQTVGYYEAGKQWPQPVQAAALRALLGIEVPDSPDTVRPVKMNRLSPEAARGVRFAALRMSETLTALLREANEAEEYAEAASLEATAIATMQAHAAQQLAASKTAPPRQRRGTK